jgi:pyruvate oxidase
MANTIKSGLAMLKVLESWGVKHIYGIPGGSINSTMDALYKEQNVLRYIQVRHEETGALAAAAEAKLTGEIGVCFGSAGPGATHLFNGLYDAKMDNVPLLVLVGQVASAVMNADYFQELNENPIFADVSIYNRTVMTPASLPPVIDEAIRRAYKEKGVAVVTLPVDFGTADIPDIDISSAANHRKGALMPDSADIQAAAELITKAEHPVLYVGQGIRGAQDEALALAEHFSMPIVASVLAKGILPDSTPYYMGSAARVATKPANEALALADLIVFAGSNFPFARNFFPAAAKFIQIDNDPSKLGKRHKTDVAILSDAKEAMVALIKAGKKREETGFFTASIENRKNWNAWMQSFENRDDSPLRPEPVFKEINRIAADDAIFITDVGNCTIYAVRHLNMNGRRQQFTTSGWFATMGYGIPGGIAAKLRFPNRQVFTLSGDGAFAMVMQDILTQVKYQLPIINVVFSNDSFGFIEAEQEDTNEKKFGVLLQGAEFAAAAEAMGAKGFAVRRRSELEAAFSAAEKSRVPVVIDIKMKNERPFPAEAMVLDTEKYTADEIAAFKKRYESEMPTLKEILERQQNNR